MSSRLGIVLLLSLGSAACGAEAEPRPEWIVEVSTDAPVPQLGDRLLVETLTADGELACEGCRRVLGAGSADDLPASFSIVPRGAPLLLRTRLFRAIATGGDGLPDSDQLIDHLAVLPDTTGRHRLAVALSLDCFGVPADLAGRRTCAPQSRKLVAIDELVDRPALTLATGSSELATTRPCRDEAPDGMTCIPGGLFLRGDARAPILQEATDANRERLVRLAPYYLDTDEVSVGQIRALLRDGSLNEAPVLRGLPTEASGACTFLGQTSAKNDQSPINCVHRSFAEQACRALGKRLPTEAEWEYAAGNRQDETEFPWGSDPNICQYAVVSRAAVNFGDNFIPFTACINLAGITALNGPLPRGESADVTRQGVRNLAGNLSELVADAFGSYSGPCWGDAVPLDDPRCQESDVPEFPVTIRGSNWAGPFFSATATARNSYRDIELGTTGLGFRCANDAE